MTPTIVDRLGRIKWEHYPCGGYLHVSYVIEAPPYGFPQEFDVPVPVEQPPRLSPAQRGVRTRYANALAPGAAADAGEEA